MCACTIEIRICNDESTGHVADDDDVVSCVVGRCTFGDLKLLKWNLASAFVDHLTKRIASCALRSEPACGRDEKASLCECDPISVMRLAWRRAGFVSTASAHGLRLRHVWRGTACDSSPGYSRWGSFHWALFSTGPVWLRLSGSCVRLFAPCRACARGWSTSFRYFGLTRTDSRCFGLTRTVASQCIHRYCARRRLWSCFCSLCSLRRRLWSEHRRDCLVCCPRWSLHDHICLVVCLRRPLI